MRFEQRQVISPADYQQYDLAPFCTVCLTEEIDGTARVHGWIMRRGDKYALLAERWIRGSPPQVGEFKYDSFEAACLTAVFLLSDNDL